MFATENLKKLALAFASKFGSVEPSNAWEYVSVVLDTQDVRNSTLMEVGDALEDKGVLEFIFQEDCVPWLRFMVCSASVKMNRNDIDLNVHVNEFIRQICYLMKNDSVVCDGVTTPENVNILCWYTTTLTLMKSDVAITAAENLMNAIQKYLIENNGEVYSGTRVCIAVLSAIIENVENMSNDELLNNCLRLVQLVDKKNVSNTRDYAVKKLIAKSLLLQDPVNGIEKVWTCIQNFVLRRDANCEEDTLTASTLICILVDDIYLKGVLDLSCMVQLPYFWLVIQSFFLHSDICIRKRGAYVMQHVLKSIHEATEKDGLGGKKSWMGDFLDIINQIECCNSMHLLNQVMDRIKHLCCLVQQDAASFSQCQTFHSESEWDETETDAKSKTTTLSAEVKLHSSGLYPLPTFHWLKAIFHITLNLTMPNIKKNMLKSVLTVFPLNFKDESLQYWVCYEFLPMIDVNIYFSPLFYDGDMGCKSEDVPVFVSHGVVDSHPGCYIPYFLSRLIRTIDTPLVERFIRGIVDIVCERNLVMSMNGIKWIFRVFAEISLENVVSTNFLSSNDLQKVYLFLRRNLHCCTPMLKNQIYTGLLKIVLVGFDMSGENAFQLVKFYEEATHFGYSDSLKQDFLHKMSQAVLSESVCRCQPDPCLVGKSLALAYTALMHYSMEKSAESCKVLLESRFSSVSKLYANPYMLKDEREYSMQFIFGVNSLVRHDILENKRSLLVHSHILIMFEDIKVDLASFLCSELQSVLVGKNIENAAFDSFDSVLMCASSLGNLLLLNEDENSMSTVVERLFDHVLRQMDGGAMKGFHALLCIVIIGEVLQDVCLQENSRNISYIKPVIQISNSLLNENCISSREHKICIESMENENNAILVDMAKKYKQYGRFHEIYSWYQWNIIGSLSLFKPGKEMLLNHSLYDIVLDQIDNCGVDLLPKIIDCVRVYSRLVLPATEQVDKKDVLSKLSQVFSTIWRMSVNSSDSIDVTCISHFIGLLFDNVVLSHIDPEICKEYYNEIYILGVNGRVHLLQRLVVTATLVWKKYPKLSIPFIDEIIQLLTYKEVNKNEATDIPDIVDPCTVCRFVTLEYLEHIQLSKNIDALAKKSIFDVLIKKLIDRNLENDFCKPAMIGRESFGQKLRCWQALCILSHSVDIELLAKIIDTCFETLQQNSIYSIRSSMEIFCAAMAKKFPVHVIPKLLKALEDANISHQYLASIYIILGHVVHDNISSGRNFDNEFTTSIVDCVVPLVAYSAGLPRTIALYLLSMLIPQLVSKSKYTTSILEFIMQNKDSLKIIQRSRVFFTEFELEKKCCLNGLTTMEVDNTGEIIPDHLLTVIEGILKLMTKESGKKEQKESHFYESQGVKSIESCANIDTLQTKIVPYDELQLAIVENEQQLSRNGIGREVS